jgi:hypothetical protein
MLPIAVQWFIAVMVLVLVASVAWIAFMQIRIATAQHRLDLYDKRFKVFVAAGTYLRRLQNEGKVSEANLKEYNLGVAGATFLFENDVNVYLDALRRRSLSLNALSKQLTSMDPDADGRDEVIDKINAWMDDFESEYSRLVSTFTPYLKYQGKRGFNIL